MKNSPSTIVSRVLVISVLLTGGGTFAQAADIGFELQVYPTGVIPGIRYESAISDRSAINLRLGGQVIRHQDFGVHDDERGNGLGMSLGYKRYFRTGQQGPAWGVRTDIWFNTLDWIDDESTADEMSGTTDVIVLQPTVDLSWQYFATPQLFISPSVAAGFEINVVTEGEEVGEGFIYLLGVTMGYRF